ncbi:MAG: PEP-CTERM sorting domain-containing protein [Gammaproteobacteria bacterium]
MSWSACKALVRNTTQGDRRLNNFWSGLVAAPLLVVSASSSAALITFDFTDQDFRPDPGLSSQNDRFFKLDGFDLRIRGFSQGALAQRVAKNQDGLGVVGFNEAGQNGIDSMGFNESLVFNVRNPTFNRYSSVSLHSIGLSNFSNRIFNNQPKEEFDLRIGSGPNFTAVLDEFTPSDPNWNRSGDVWLASEGLTDDQRVVDKRFSIRADGPNSERNDQFRVASVTFDVVKVAEPATLFLTALGLGLVGFAGARRR